MKDDTLLGAFNWRLNLLCVAAFSAVAAASFVAWATPLGPDDLSLSDWVDQAIIAVLSYELMTLKRRAAVWWDVARDHGFVSRKGL